MDRLAEQRGYRNGGNFYYSNRSVPYGHINEVYNGDDIRFI